MPIYEYKSAESGCEYCDPGFEALQSLEAEPLAQCPKCRGPVKKILSAFSVNKSERDLLSPKNIEKNGFTQYRKAGDGVYEKTAGKGPKLIKK